MVNPDKMIRADRTRVSQVRHTSSKAMFFTMFVVLKTGPWIVLLFPMFYAKFNNYNGTLFTIRARSVNYFIYFILDQKRPRRRAYFYQKTYTPTEETATHACKIDIVDKNYPAHV
ncbi:hypothetical protein AZE42_06559 [Rhizopogon vesiculosus]|uniref:Uncharacterized protein n=1 Tax=Rhizopogon vesiculosus TaxID=180088 RepID=A0A1J8PKH4_9AGAM|nr:hypothetical protein AZE42_06559 [Rhizopogon vesiculosus]